MSIRLRLARLNLAQRAAVLVGVLAVLAALVYVSLPFEDRRVRCNPPITGSEPSRELNAIESRLAEARKRAQASLGVNVIPSCRNAGRDRLYRAALSTGAVLIGVLAAVVLLGPTRREGEPTG